jgi:hypothetical protein
MRQVFQKLNECPRFHETARNSVRHKGQIRAVHISVSNSSCVEVNFDAEMTVFLKGNDARWSSLHRNYARRAHAPSLRHGAVQPVQELLNLTGILLRICKGPLKLCA